MAALVVLSQPTRLLVAMNTSGAMSWGCLTGSRRRPLAGAGAGAGARAGSRALVCTGQRRASQAESAERHRHGRASAAAAAAAARVLSQGRAAPGATSTSGQGGPPTGPFAREPGERDPVPGTPRRRSTGTAAAGSARDRQHRQRQRQRPGRRRVGEGARRAEKKNVSWAARGASEGARERGRGERGEGACRGIREGSRRGQAVGRGRRGEPRRPWFASQGPRHGVCLLAAVRGDTCAPSRPAPPARRAAGSPRMRPGRGTGAANATRPRRSLGRAVEKEKEKKKKKGLRCWMPRGAPCPYSRGPCFFPLGRAAGPPARRAAAMT